MDTGVVSAMVTHTISVAWIRCLIEEGVDFVNKHTGDTEEDEMVIFKNLQAKTGAFDFPDAKCSPRGMEKNLLEVLGNLHLRNENEQVDEIFRSKEFRSAILEHVGRIRARDFSGKSRFSR